MQAKDVMVTDFESVPHATPLLEAVERMRNLKIKTGEVDIRCLVVSDTEGRSTHIITEADIIRAILPWFFREKRFFDFVGKWLSKDLPGASLTELWGDLAAAARKRVVGDILADTPLISVDEGDSLLKVAYVMHIDRIKSVPVTRDGEIVGIVYRTAIFEAIASEIVKPKHR